MILLDKLPFREHTLSLEELNTWCYFLYCISDILWSLITNDLNIFVLIGSFFLKKKIPINTFTVLKFSIFFVF